jgi:hypothetical protein
LAAIGRQLENPPENPQKVLELGMDFNRVQQELDERMRQWETLSADV